MQLDMDAAATTVADIEALVRPSWSLPTHVPVQVSPFVWLGAIEDAYSEEFLRTHGITHILNCADYVSPAPAAFASMSFVHLQLPALDTMEYPLLQRHFAQAAVFLDVAAARGGKVLVHCVAGMNRSAALVAAYLLFRHHIPYHASLKRMALFRPILSNAGFRHQLATFAQGLQLLTPTPAPVP
jgi:predicted protein tyrosine phosphatase